MVTSFGPDGPSGMTANAVTSLSLEPPLMIVCFDRTARTLAAVEHSGRFAIHFLAHDQEELAAPLRLQAARGGEVRGPATGRERAGVPALDGSLAGLACELRELLPGGDHLIAIGEVVDLWTREGEPLVFFQRRLLGADRPGAGAARGGRGARGPLARA